MKTHVATVADCGPREIRANLVDLLAADSLLMPDGWWHSYSADVERRVALYAGIPVTYAAGADPEGGDQ